MSSRIRSLLLLALLFPAAAVAQPLGTFRWQTQPFCNVVTLTAVRSGDVFMLDGFDDQCGEGPRAPVTGTAVPNPDGTIAIGLNLIAAPGAAPTHVAASIDLNSLSGTWFDSRDDSGAFVFVTDGVTTGSRRRTRSAIGAVAVDQEQVQLRVNGRCEEGAFIREIDELGEVACDSPQGGLIAVGDGLSRIEAGSKITLDVQRRDGAPDGAFLLQNLNGFTADGDFSFGGPPPPAGPATRLLWYPKKAAFRAGLVGNAEWTDDNIGNFSVAMGINPVASGAGSVAMGSSSVAGGDSSVAMGFQAKAPGSGAVALGTQVQATGSGAFALGTNARAEGNGSFAFADRSTTDLLTVGRNQFHVRATGGVTFFSNEGATLGVTLAPDGSQWLGVSDADKKTGFRDLDGDEVLAKIARMPVREWSYTSQDPHIRHVGPTAQDFHAAFGLGEDPLRIGTLDADGITLAAVKALEARLRALIEGNERLARENDELRRRVDRLEIETLKKGSR